MPPPARRRPACYGPPLLALALLHDARIEAYARIIEEDAAIYLADIHSGDFAGEKCLHRLLELERDAQVFGEVIKGPHRQYAKGGIRADERRRHRRDRSVTSSAHDESTKTARLVGERSEIGP